MSTAGTFLFLLLVGVLLAVMLSIVFHTLRTGISPMPTSAKVRRQVLSLLPVELEGTLLELGSGWGTLAFALADHCPRARVVAFELSPLPYAFSRLRQRLRPRPNLQLVREDFFRASFSGASTIVCYLFPGAMSRLALRFAEELAPGTRILSHTFALRGWKPLRTLVVDDLYRTPIYLYEAPPPQGGTDTASTEPGR